MAPGVARIKDILAECGIEDAEVVQGPLGGILSPGVVACALPYPLEADPPPGDGPFGLIASFARRHYYRILADRLIRARDRLRALLAERGPGPSAAKRDFPIHVNSRIDEKGIASAAGLGSIGLHSLLISRLSGCACVLGAMGLPFAPEGASRPLPSPLLHPTCPSCGACLRACPVGAIAPSGGVDLGLCLQAYMSGDRPLPETLITSWGRRFYGCDDCLRACPFASGSIGPGLSAEEEGCGALGAAVDLRSVLEAEDEGLKELFRGSALGMAWMRPSTLRKNAKMALLSRSKG